MSTQPAGTPTNLAALRLADAVQVNHRERLLFALADSIRGKGLHSVQITDVVGRAGASRRTFYRCFPDKDAAIVALADMIFALSIDHVAAAVDRSASPDTKIDQGVDAFLTFVASDPVLITAIRTELPTLGPIGVRIHLDSVDRFAALMIELLGPLPIDAGFPTDDASLKLARMLIAGLDGAFARTIARGEPILDLAPVAKMLFRRALHASPG